MIRKKKKDYTTAKSAAKIVGGAGIAVGGGLLGDAITKKGGDYLENSELKAKDAGSIGKKLVDQVKKNGGPKIIEDPNFQNSAYVGTGAGKRVRNAIAYLKKKSRSSGNKNYKKAADRIKDAVEGIYGSKVVDNLGKDDNTKD